MGLSEVWGGDEKCPNLKYVKVTDCITKIKKPENSSDTMFP